MPAVTVSAELMPKQVPSVVVYIDGHRAGALEFHDWNMAYAAALSLSDDMGRVIRATLRNWLATEHAGQRKEPM
jgi:hypothetical protein